MRVVIFWQRCQTAPATQGTRHETTGGLRIDHRRPTPAPSTGTRWKTPPGIGAAGKPTPAPSCFRAALLFEGRVRIQNNANKPKELESNPSGRPWGHSPAGTFPSGASATIEASDDATLATMTWRPWRPWRHMARVGMREGRSVAMAGHGGAKGKRPTRARSSRTVTRGALQLNHRPTEVGLAVSDTSSYGV